jgi:hypothetical protein
MPVTRQAPDNRQLRRRWCGLAGACCRVRRINLFKPCEAIIRRCRRLSSMSNIFFEDHPPSAPQSILLIASKSELSATSDRTPVGCGEIRFAGK